MNDTIRVLVIDDSAYNRRTIIKMLESAPGVEVVGYACDGEEGLRKVFDLKPDLVTLDLEMPRIDGFTFLRIVMGSRPLPVIVVSARTEDENVFRALEFGAVDFVAKPTAKISPELFNIRDDLVRKVLQGARTDMSKVLKRAPMPDRPVKRPDRAGAVVLPTGSGFRNLVVIGASTGGPPALQTIFSSIREPLPVAFAIVQHMPPGFTRAFAERMNKFSGLNIREAADGDRLEAGTVLIAPGGKNLLVENRGGHLVVCTQSPSAQSRYVPSVDQLFASAADHCGPSVVGVVLTGMGNDGQQGVRAIHQRGGRIIAESEESCVVYGMPKEAIATGYVDRVAPLPLICGEILRSCNC